MDDNDLLKNGLNDKAIQERIDNGLYNGNFQVKTKTIGNIFFTNVFTLFNFLNIGLAVAVALVHSYRNVLFVGVVLWNIAIGIFQEIQAKLTIDKLSLLSQPRTRVIRNGKENIIENTEIVLDDIMILESGNQICADSVILEGEISVDESLVTGESNPVIKKKDQEILSGSHVIAGSVTAKAIHVGKDNYVNKIIGNAKYLKKPNSEIMKSTKFIIKVVSIVLVPIMIILFWKQRFILEEPLQESVVSTVAAVIGMIPNGLMLLSTCVLAVAVVRLSKKNTLVQELYCIETLARVDVLCLDKTGTITEGKMQFDKLVPLNDVEETFVSEGLNTFAYYMSDRNATINAVRERYKEITSEWKLLHSVPFQSKNKWSAAYFDNKGTYILGAPESVLRETFLEYKDIVESYTSNGDRVLVFAHSNEYLLNDELPSKVVPLALLIINEKIRENATETINYFKEQGVALKVISGDNPITVSNIAKRVGIENSDSYIDMSSVKETDSILDIAERYVVFGRVSPNQKLELVKALKSNNHTVAMTGDGVNDVLALKEADCSIAMYSGSDATRSISQLVLLDSDFASMPAIVAEGRRSINNLQRSARLYIVKTIYSILLALIFIFLPLAYPYEPIQFTLIGAFAIGIPSFILALEPNFKRIDGKFLTNVFRIAIPGGVLVVTNVLITMFATWFFRVNEADTSTLAMLSMMITSMIVLFNICKPFNRMKTALYISLLVAFGLCITLLSELFMVTRVSTLLLILIAILGGVSFGIFTIYRRITDFVINKLGD